jgi:hypothetical protein
VKAGSRNAGNLVAGGFWAAFSLSASSTARAAPESFIIEILIATAPDGTEAHYY